jgi:hypothetical protein
MVAHDELVGELKQLSLLYLDTKKLIIQAEQVDPQARSNIAVFKEQRDAFDHVMRAVFSALQDENFTIEQVRFQMEKAKGHLYRACYDSLDGLGVSWKLRIAAVTKDVPNEAIKAVYPDYWTHIPELDKLDAQISEHRAKKDIGPLTNENLEQYSQSVLRVAEIGAIATSKGKAFQDWQSRERRTNWLWKIATPLLIGVGLLVSKITYDHLSGPKNPPSAPIHAGSGTSSAAGAPPVPIVSPSPVSP